MNQLIDESKLKFSYLFLLYLLTLLFLSLPAFYFLEAGRKNWGFPALAGKGTERIAALLLVPLNYSASFMKPRFFFLKRWGKNAEAISFDQLKLPFSCKFISRKASSSLSSFSELKLRQRKRLCLIFPEDLSSGRSKSFRSLRTGVWYLDTL